MAPKHSGGGAFKKPRPMLAAKNDAKAACEAEQGCGLPHAKLWEKGAAFMSYLEASRLKKENHELDLVEAASKVYPVNLEAFVSPQGDYHGE